MSLTGLALVNNMRKLLLAIAVVAISACAANPKPALVSSGPKAVEVARSVTFEQAHLDRQRVNSKVIDRLVSSMSEVPQQGPLTNANNLRVRTDANGYMMAAGQTYSSPDGPLTNFSNIRLRTDANGYLMVVIAGGPFTGQMVGPAGCTTVPYSFVGSLTTGLCSSAANTVDLYTNNVDQVSISTTAITSVLPLAATQITSTTPTTGGFRFTSQGSILSPSDGIFTFLNQAATGFTRLQFGGTTASFPSLKTRASPAGLDVRLADDSGYGLLTAGSINLTGGSLTIDIGQYYQWNSSTRINGQTDGNLIFQNAAGTSFSRLQLGGTSASFPALNINGTGLEAKLADNSAYTTFAASQFNAGATAGVSGTCDTPTFTGGVATTCGGSGGSVDGTYFVAGNFTTANNTNFQLITGLAWTFPVTTAINVPFRCSLVYSQATAAVSDSLGIQAVTVAPTNAMFTGSAETALGTTAYGDLTAFSSTTATAVVTFTPSATATTFNAYIDGMIEHPSNASSSAFQIQIKTTAGADAITVYRGSYCKVG